MDQSLSIKEGAVRKMSMDTPIVLYFGTLSCNVCHSVLPKLLEIIKDYPVSLFKIQADENQELAGQLTVFTVPTILIFYKGNEILRESRFIDFKNIEKLLINIYR